MKDAIKKLVAGTPLEGAARSVYRAFRGAPAPEPQQQPAAPPPAPVPLSLNELYDAQTAEVMQRVLEPGSNCIDVGCHHGMILDEMLRLSPSGTHYAFEPLPHMFAALAAKYAGRANVRLFEAALSEAPGTSTFQHVVTNPGYSGLLRRRYDRPHEDVVEIQVQVLRLDDLIPEDMAIRFVKIDVEGAELPVMRGAKRMLAHCRPFMVFESGLGGSEFYGTKPEMVFDLLAECGLRVSLMTDWLASGGDRTLSREALADQFNNGRNYYFLAHP